MNDNAHAPDRKYGCPGYARLPANLKSALRGMLSSPGMPCTSEDVDQDGGDVIAIRQRQGRGCGEIETICRQALCNRQAWRGHGNHRRPIWLLALWSEERPSLNAGRLELAHNTVAIMLNEHQ